MGAEVKVIEFPIENAYTRTYKLRAARKTTNTVEVSVPRDFVRRLAWRANLTVKELTVQYRAVAYFGGGDELLYRFEKIEGMGTSHEDSV